MNALGLALLVGLAAPASAQDAEDAATLLRGCVEAAGTGAGGECRGAYARVCTADRAEGPTTIGMSACALAERDGWDRILNEVYAELVLESKRRARADEEAGLAPASLEEMLTEAQRAWIAFRDADCEHDYALWGEGSQRQVAGAVCLSERTANRVLELRDKLEQMRGK